MIEWLDVLRWAHVLGACVLIGTGSGIAFFMVMAHGSRDAAVIAGTARIVVIADWVFTATAAALQPVTGYLMARELGWALSEPWLALSIGLYVFIGVFWLPVVWIQKEMRDEVQAGGLTARYQRLYRVWFTCGIPAFAAILVLLWLMLTRPALW